MSGQNVMSEILLKSSNEIEWMIPNFFLLPKAFSYFLDSPFFPYLHGTYCLRCWPNSSDFGIFIALIRIHSTSRCNITFSLGIKKKGGLEYLSGMRNSDFEGNRDPGVFLHVGREYLQRNKTNFSHRGEISFFCMLLSGSSKDAVSQTIRSKVKDVATETSDGDFSNSQKRFEDDRGESQGLIVKDAATETSEGDFSNSQKRFEENRRATQKLTGTWQTIISQMYNTKESADVRFVVNGQVFEAHRWVLANRSPEFNRLLTGPNAALNTHIVDAENVTDAGFHTLLRFLYKDTLETNDKKSIVEAFHCSVTYQVKDLQTKCEEMSIWEITPDEVCILLDCGLDLPTLRNNCLALLRRKGAAALSSPAFLEIRPRTICFMLESGALENVPVLERIKRVLEWCVHPNQEDVEYASVRDKLLHEKTGPLLGRLQFENLNLEEISHVVNEYRGLITPEELVCFLRHLHTRDASDLPECCLPTSRNASCGNS